MNVILSLYPNVRGLGYASIDMPQELLDSGIITIRRRENDSIMHRIGEFIDVTRPKIIILRETEASTEGYGTRAKNLLKKIMAMANEKHIPLYQYSRQQIRETFEIFGAKTKYEISQKVTEWFPSLKLRAPKMRKPWMQEDYRMAIFDAVALAVTHQHLSE